MNKELGWGSMHPDQEPPGFLSMRCKANPKVSADGDPRPFFFSLFLYRNATIKVRVVAIFPIQTKEYTLRYQKLKQKI